MHARPIAAILILTAALSSPMLAEEPASALAARRQALKDVIAEQWEYNLAHSPEQASSIGDKRYNDRWSDPSEKASLADVAMAKKFAARLQAIDTTGFPEQEALNRTLLVRTLGDFVEDAAFTPWRMPVTQFIGIHIDAPRIVSVLSFDSVKDYEDYIKRLKALPAVFDETTVNMRRGMADGLMPPKILLERVNVQLEGLATQKPEDSPFAGPVAKFADSIPAGEQARLHDAVIAAIRESVLPAYVKFAKFVKSEYTPKGKAESGAWALPDGAHRYAVAVRRFTTTNKTPEEIHELGLSEVARIHRAMNAIAKTHGFDDWKAFSASFAANADLKTKSREDVLQRYRRYIAGIEPQLPRFFGRLPKGRVEVHPVEAFREKQAAGAEYVQGTPDGSRPGHVEVNTGHFGNVAVAMEATAYHEGIPGHHMQIAISQELEGLPPFRQQAFYGAFIEGWALYAESLAKEMGGYKDSYNDYGRLLSENFRAVRLVVDTGMHAKKWTREQAMKYAAENAGGTEQGASVEIERYMAWPGQALSYKVGQLAISDLRQRAEKALGPAFDIRSFHDEVLGGGALPLDVLSDRIDQWIAARSARKAANS